jgi:hypothetical protein
MSQLMVNKTLLSVRFYKIALFHHFSLGTPHSAARPLIYMSIGLTESYIRLQPCCVAEIASYCVVSQTHERCLYLPPPFTSWHLVCHVIEAYLHRNCIEIT